MDIKEVEKRLSVSCANIRFYEKEGLISPQRKENNYRNYSEEDIAKLKKILVLRKLGISVREIADMQNGSLSLNDAVENNIKRLEEMIDELQGSLEISKKLEQDNATFDTLDEEKYWNIIDSAENRGQKLVDICKDYLQFEKNVFYTMWKWVFFMDVNKWREKLGKHRALAVFFLFLCVGRGLGNKFIWQGSFWFGFFQPFILFLAVSFLILPLYILSKKRLKLPG